MWQSQILNLKERHDTTFNVHMILSMWKATLYLYILILTLTRVYLIPCIPLSRDDPQLRNVCYSVCGKTEGRLSLFVVSRQCFCYVAQYCMIVPQCRTRTQCKQICVCGEISQGWISRAECSNITLFVLSCLQNLRLDWSHSIHWIEAVCCQMFI